MTQSILITSTPSLLHASVPLGPMTAAAAKAAGVLAIALIVAACMRRGSAAARHLVLTLALAVSLLLPLAAIITPSWNLAVLPPAAKPIVVAPQAMPLAVPPGIQRPSPDLENHSAFQEEETASFSRPSMSGPTAGPIERASSPAKPVRRLTISTLILAVWLAGTIVIGLGWIVGVVAASQLARSARAVGIGSLKTAGDDLCADLQIRRRVAVRIGDAITMPLTTGMFRPVLLLPTDANHWPAGKVQSVLLHELAHVKRHDCATQLLAQLVCAIYWFNPLAWLAAGRQRVERERACDDFVLRRGADPVSYADLLLTVAASLRGRSPADLTGIAMARRSGLRDRVTKVLTAAVNRRPVNRFAAIAAMLIALTLVIPLGAVHLASRSAVARAATIPATIYSSDKPKSTDDSTASPETDRLVIVPPTGETKPGYLTGGGYPLAMNDRFRAPDAAYRPGPWFFLLNSDLSEPIQINPLNLGLPADAPIEEIVKRTATGDIYQPTLGTLVPVRGSLMAPLEMPADNRWVVEDIKFYDFIRTMTREQIARKVLAYHHAHPERTAWQVKAGQHFAILRANGGISCSAVRTTGKDLYIFYVPIGSVKLATTRPATRPVIESVTQEPGKTIRLFVHDSRVQLRQNNNVIEADRIAISPIGGAGCTVDVSNGMVRATCTDGNVLTGSRLVILTNGKVTGEDGRVPATTGSATPQAVRQPKPDAKASGLQITVVSTKDGKPVAGANIHVVGGEDSFTDDDGHAAFDRLTPGSWDIEATAAGKAKVIKHLNLIGTESNSLTIALPDGGSIRGKITDAAGIPVPGIGLNVYPGDDISRVDFVKTDADGDFSLDNLPLDQACRILIVDDHYVSVWKKMSLPASDSHQVMNLVLQPKPPGGSVAGSITDNDGKPVAGALIVYYGGSNRAQKSARSGGTGNFQLDGIDPSGGSVDEIIVRARGWAPLAVPIRQLGTPQAPAWLAVRLTEKGHPISGQVVDEDGMPIKDVFVSAGARNRTSNDPRNLVVRTGRDGRFQFDSLPGRATFDFSSDGFGDIRWKALPLDGAQDVKVVLTRKMPFTGKVVDADTGQPVPQFNVKIGNHLHGEEFAAGTGEFQLLDLEPGAKVDLMVTADGYPVQYFDDVKDTSKDHGPPVVLRLSTHPADHVRIAGRIIGATGEPVAGVEVCAIAYRPGDEEFPRDLRFNWDELRSGQLAIQQFIRSVDKTKTAADGTFAFASVRGPEVDLAYWKTGVPQARLVNVAAPPAEKREHLEIRVPAPATISGRINRKAYAEISGLTLRLATDRRYEMELRTQDGQDRYKFSDVPPGSYELSIEGKAVSEGNGAFSFPDIGHAEVKVAAGESVTLDLGFKSGP